MKRSRDMDAPTGTPSSLISSPTDADHPVVAFHREAWVGDAWHVIRETFHTEYVARFQEGVTSASSGATYKQTIAEPHKFWRHCREALAKWVLSQTARYQPRDAHGDVDYKALSAVNFLPSRSMLQSVFPTIATTGSSSTASTTFDAQLVRDLTFKSTTAVRNDALFIQDVTNFVSEFDLGDKCIKAVQSVEAHIAEMLRTSPNPSSNSSHQRRHGSSSNVAWLQPHLRRVEQSVPESEQRIKGILMEVGVAWPDRYATDAVGAFNNKGPLSKSFRNVRPVLIPEDSWKRLLDCYRAFGAAMDAERYGLTASPEDVQEAFAAYRCATVVLRYEHCLASGSLQLCADSKLKLSLHAAGYNVMDLCASPINAYMATPHEAGLVPRRFCSAFWDVDRFFGSMGSALLFNIDTSYAAFRQRDEALLAALPQYRTSRALHADPIDAPLLCTLDVPYDEDLCELLFLKLAQDSRSFRDRVAPKSTDNEDAVTTSASSSRVPWADFVLVLPLWWNVPLDGQRCPKRFITDKGEGAGDDEAMWKLVQHHADYLEQGKRIEYLWLQELPASLLPAISPESSADAEHGRGRARDGYLGVFDAVIPREYYTYQCTATNKPLTGVTATEVIGVSLQALPTSEAPSKRRLQTVLEQFYSVQSSTVH